MLKYIIEVIKMKRVFLLSSILCWSLLGSWVLGQQAGQESVRFATYNVSLNRNEHGQLLEDLQDPRHNQAKKVAAVLQVNRPDVVLLNEFDFDEEGHSVAAFMENFLGVSQYGHQPILYAHVYFAPVNTGVDSGHDLDGDGKLTGTANDAFGFGRHSGQYGMVVLSRFPIDRENARTFQKFLWKDMPDAQWPIVPETKESFYSDEVKEIFRLSSKSHWDVPIRIGDRTIHFLVSHPTPPTFDQAEDRNGCRNHDEIRFWADYVVPEKGDYIYDDNGVEGGLDSGDHFVIAGDLNADPNDGDSRDAAAHQLTTHELINNSFTPSSEGAAEAAKKTSGKNRTQVGDHAYDTGDFNDQSVGNLRIDYVLPSKTLTVSESGVFWPKMHTLNYTLVRVSDHRLVWIDIDL
jgi:3-phytase/alkaline phosphatase D